VFEELRVAETPVAARKARALAYFTAGFLHRPELETLAGLAEGGPLELFALGGWQYVESSEALRVRCLLHALERWPGPAKLRLVPWPRRFSTALSVGIWAHMARKLGCGQLAWRSIEDAQHDFSAPAPPVNAASDEAAPAGSFGAGTEISSSLSPTLQQCRDDIARGAELRYVFPDVEEELKRRFGNQARGGLTILLTGLSGAGKSTLGRNLATFLSLQVSRPLTLLDGDVVRQHLSSELGFSKEHRDLNVRRIGFVAGEITKNGGIAVCAPIAPYEQARRFVRQLIEEQGAFVEVHVATTLEQCESRDRKGHYARARRGEIKQFTGIDDPYEIPAAPEVRIKTHGRTPRQSLEELVDALIALGVIDPAA